MINLSYYIAVIIGIILVSSAMYLFIHKKTTVKLALIKWDILLIILFDSILFIVLSKIGLLIYLSAIIAFMFIPVIGWIACMIRFYRKPSRKIILSNDVIVSPADGNIIYIKRVEADEIPISMKNSKVSRLNEITKTDLLNTPCWLIGINMTPFDVHKNCSPIEGKVILNKHTSGKFISLKNVLSESENERNTFVIENDTLKVGVIQIASRMVRRIVNYIKEGDNVKKGDWIGMITFGSQVDVILPVDCSLKVKVGQQVYAKSTVIAQKEI